MTGQGQEVGRLHISLFLNDDEFDRGMNRAEQKTTSFGGKVRQASQDLFYMGNAAMMAVQGVGAVVGGMVDLSRQGAMIEKTAFAFDKLAGGAENADAWITSIQIASRGATTEFEATNQAIQLMTMGLATTADEAGRMMEVAAITAAINPELGSIENALTNIGMTMANDSWMRLDQLGVDATILKERMKELEEQGKATTDAFDIGVMEQLEANAKVIGTEVLDIGKDTAQLETTWRELKDTAAGFAMILVEDAAPALTTLLKISTDLLTTMRDLSALEFEKQNEVALNQAMNQDLQVLTPGGLTGPQAVGLPRYLGTSYLQQGQTDPNYVPYRPSRAEGLRPDVSMTYGPDMRDQTAALYDHSAALKGFVNATMGPLGQTAFGLGPQGILDTTGSRYGTQNMAAGSQVDLGGMAVPGAGGGGAGASRVGRAQDAVVAAQAMAVMEQNTLGADAAMRELYTSTSAVVDKVENAKPGSLAELLGLGGADQLEVEFYREIENALRGVEGGAEAAAEAMNIYELSTGIATGASEVLDGQLDRLAEKLKNKELTPQQFVDEMMKLQNMDFGNVNAFIGDLIDQGDVELAQQWIDKLSQLETINLSGFTGTFAPAEGPEDAVDILASGLQAPPKPTFQGMVDTPAGFETIGPDNPFMAAIMPGQGDLAQASPLQLMLDDIDTVEEELTGMQGMVSGVFDPAIEDVDLLGQNLDAITAKEHQIKIILKPTDDPESQSILFNMVLAENDIQGNPLGVGQ